jgi:lysophospholipase L1-like esterase
MTRYDLLLRRIGIRAEPLPALDQLERLYVGSPEAARFRRFLTRFAESVTDAGARFVVVCFPLADQLRARDRRPQAAVADMGRAIHLEFLDLFGPYQLAARGRPALLFEADGLHPNAAGHSVAAREIVNMLRPWLTAHGTRLSTAPPIPGQ